MQHNPNEEFICCQCLKEVNGRFLFCSMECEDKFNAISQGKESIES